MSIGLVSDEEFEKELGKVSGNKDSSTPTSRPVAQIEIIERPGRKEGDNNVPESLRKIIGEEAVINGRQSALDIAQDFGISSSQVSAYAKGATSTASYNTPSQSLISHINKSRSRAIKKASHVLHSALSSISQEKLDYADADKLSGIAKDMSAIIKNLEPKQEAQSDAKNAPQFVIFAPQFRQESSFEVIEVKE